MFINKSEALSKLLKYLDSAGTSPQHLMDITNGQFLIFGGALRDAIAGEQTCNDIDIIVSEELTDKKYWKGFMRTKKDKYEYKYANRVNIIATTPPNSISIDLIYKKNSDTLMGALNIVKNVDINVNGIAWHPNAGFMEILPDAIKCCERKVFWVNRSGAGYDTIKIRERIKKLTDKDWLEVKSV